VTIYLTSNPDGADIYVDDSFSGKTPGNSKLKPGQHSLRMFITDSSLALKEHSVNVVNVVNVSRWQGSGRFAVRLIRRGWSSSKVENLRKAGKQSRPLNHVSRLPELNQAILLVHAAEAVFRHIPQQTKPCQAGLYVLFHVSLLSGLWPPSTSSKTGEMTHRV